MQAVNDNNKLIRDCNSIISQKQLKDVRYKHVLPINLSDFNKLSKKGAGIGMD